MAIIAKHCVPVSSRWVDKFILTCDNQLAVVFKPHHVCCLYPAAGKTLFDLAIVWPRPGKFVHRFLYKILPYKIIKDPCPEAPCGVQTLCCGNTLPTTISITFSGGLSGTYTLTWNSGASQWQNTAAALCGDHTSTITLVCQDLGLGPLFYLSIVSNGGTGCTVAAQVGASSATCSPFSVSFPTMTGHSGTCCHGTFFSAAATA